MISVSEPLIGAREHEYVEECLRTGWISSSGRFIDLFEERWAAYCGRRFGVAMANGTVALQAAVAALRLQPGDEIIMPSFTIISCALAAVYNDCVPVLVDAEPRTGCMDVAAIEARITPRTRAIMPVHMYGHPVAMGAVLELAARHKLAIIEDAAEAHGAELTMDGGATWRRCGSFGEMSCFSFYANKLVTTGEGGMVLTDDAALAERLRSQRNLAFQPQRRFLHDELGHNFRMTNLQAAVGVGQLERIDDIVARKRRQGARYRERLAGVPGLRMLPEEPWARSVFWMNGAVLQQSDARAFAGALAKRGVETRPFFLGLHEQPALHRRGLCAGERHPVTEHLAAAGLYLPSGVGLTDAHLDDVVQAVRAELC